MQALTFSYLPEYKRLLERKKAVAAELLVFGRKAKSNLGENGLLRLKIAYDDEGDNAEEKRKALRERLEAEVQMARWLGMPFNHQGDLFGSDRRPADELAHAEGFKAGSDPTTPKKPPEKYGVTGPLATAWMRGFDDAQQHFFDAMEKAGKSADKATGATILKRPSLGDSAPDDDETENHAVH